MSVAVGQLGLLRIERGTLIFAAVLALSGIVMAVYHQSFSTIFALWQLSTYQYSLLVVPASAYLLWRRRDAMAAQPIAPTWPALALILILAAAWHVGRATGVQAIEHAAAIAAIPATVLAVLGVRVFRAATFPLLLPLITIPVGDLLVPPLMAVTAAGSTLLLELCGVPVQRQGMYLSLPGGDFEIADVCAGANFLLAGVTLALLFAYSTYRSIRRRCVFVTAAGVVFVLGNCVRAFLVMLVASYTHLRYLTGYDHIAFGLVFFALLLMVLLWFGNRYRDTGRPDVAAPIASSSHDLDRSGVAIVTACAILALLTGTLAQAYAPDSLATRELQLRLPAISGCSTPAPWSAAWSPAMKNPDAQISGSYDCGTADVHLMVVAYAQRRQGKEVVGSDNQIVPHEWRVAGTERHISVQLRDSVELPVNELRLGHETDAVLTWYWYSVNGRELRSPYAVKFFEALAAVTLQPTLSRAYLISVTSTHSDAASLQAQAGLVAQALRQAAAE